MFSGPAFSRCSAAKTELCVTVVFFELWFLSIPKSSRHAQSFQLTSVAAVCDRRNYLDPALIERPYNQSTERTGFSRRPSASDIRELFVLKLKA
jgi:hypothetical protein